MKKKIFLVIALLGVIMLSSILPSVNLGGKAMAENTEGRTFTSGEIVQLPKTIDSIPKTYEAWIKLSPSITERGGVIFGNYHSNDYPSLSFGVYENGAPRIYYRNGNDTASHVFSSADIRSDDYVHLAITWGNSTLTCYINGEEKGTLSGNIPNYNMNNPMCIGSDLRVGNKLFFKGAIKQVAVYSEVRSQEQIKADMQALDLTNDKMMMAFNLVAGQDGLTDLSGNGYDVLPAWIGAEHIDIPKDYAFSFMAIGDTQIITENDALNGTTNLKSVYDYVLNNVEGKKVKHVFGLGDITDNDNTAEWNIAKEQIARMDGVVPYSIIRGNHDIYSSNKNMKVMSNFDRIYGPTTSDYAKQYTYCFDGEGADFRARNTIHFFSAGNFDYMVVALDYGPSDNVLNWASEIIEEHPNHNVIVTTHAYLAIDGTTLDSGDNCPPTRDYNTTNSYGVNNGDHMWEKLIKNHENIVMVMCGHDPTDKVLLTQTKGVNGNTVSQFLIDPQGMDKSGDTGMVATFYVSENGEDVTVEWYSTVKQQYYKKSNNYTFKLNVIEKAVDEDNNNTELQEEIEALEKSLATLKEELEKADVENKQELINLINGLETKINTLKGDLEKSDSDIIADINKVKDKLAGLKIDLEELVENNRSLKEKIDSLTTLAIIFSIVSSLSLIGVVILVIKKIKE